MDTAPIQLRQDLRLLDLFESLPSPSEPDSEALRHRLTALCASQAMDAPPERVEQAVQRFMAQRVEPQDFEHWKRPVDHAEWTELLATLKAGQEVLQITDRERRDWMLLPFLTGFGLTGALFFITHLTSAKAQDGSLGVFVLCLVSLLFGLMVGASLLALTHTFLASKKYKLSTVKRALSCWKDWNPIESEIFGSDRTWFLKPRKPRAQEMTQWLAVPECVEALQHIARSGVPLLGLDALHLDRLVKAHADRQRQAQDAIVAQKWEACTGLPST